MPESYIINIGRNGSSVTISFYRKGKVAMIILDYRDKRPLYEQIVEKLEHLIVCGALESNTKMPSVRALAVVLAVNPNTIQRAYAQLEQEGYLYTVVGRGNYVTCEQEWKAGRIKDTLEEVHTLLTNALQLGVTREELAEELDRASSAVQKSREEAGSEQKTEGGIRND